jgi:hypothetical protein
MVLHMKILTRTTLVLNPGSATDSKQWHGEDRKHSECEDEARYVEEHRIQILHQIS